VNDAISGSAVSAAGLVSVSSDRRQERVLVGVVLRRPPFRPLVDLDPGAALDGVLLGDARREPLLVLVDHLPGLRLPARLARRGGVAGRARRRLRTGEEL
jgi:hypothetical protein